ncbi:HTH_Tnp_Tc3_2 domain-containing protein [Trichonephila clavipes]|nr:HTH_Tnp_Tc3_2 domain-containing protein [Trichonephila clavipes]
MDITPRKRDKIIVLNEHTSMTVRDIAMVVGVGKSSVSRILRTFQDSLSSSPKREEKCGLRRKNTPRTDKILIRNSKINQSKRSTDLWRYLLDYDVEREVNTSTVQKRVLEVRAVGHQEREKKAISNSENDENTFSMGQKHLPWTLND